MAVSLLGDGALAGAAVLAEVAAALAGAAAPLVRLYGVLGHFFGGVVGHFVGGMARKNQRPFHMVVARFLGRQFGSWGWGLFCGEQVQFLNHFPSGDNL